MASRRDELNAYTFAKRRLVAQFLRPSPTGSEEGAPRPLRAVLPGVLVGVVGLAGFGAWGLFKPVPPADWSETRKYVIVADESTARYVVLDLDGVRRLHPVLNMSSARLLVSGDAARVVKVDDRILDREKLARGPALGIPYAPDHLPAPDQAAAPKSWAVCERPGRRSGPERPGSGSGGRPGRERPGSGPGGSSGPGGRPGPWPGQGVAPAVQKVVFVLAGTERAPLTGPRRLRGDQVLFVQGPDRRLHVVDATGTAYPIADDSGLLSRVVGPGRVPQPVSARWLATLHKGGAIQFPKIEGKPGTATRASRPPKHNKVGTVVVTSTAAGQQHFVVLPDRVAHVSEFMARLLAASPELSRLHPQGRPLPSDSGFAPGEPFLPPGGVTWPRATSAAVNSPGGPGSRTTVCSVLRAVNPSDGRTTVEVWAGAGFPQQPSTGTATVYVTPGSGQYFRQFKGKQTGTGTDYLLTDTGLRHAMQSNGDTAKGSVRQQPGAKDSPPMTAAQLLGYGRVRPAPVPADWSQLLPTGPRLSTGAAQQPQGS